MLLRIGTLLLLVFKKLFHVSSSIHLTHKRLPVIYVRICCHWRSMSDWVSCWKFNSSPLKQAAREPACSLTLTAPSDWLQRAVLVVLIWFCNKTKFEVSSENSRTDWILEKYLLFEAHLNHITNELWWHWFVIFSKIITSDIFCRDNSMLTREGYV